MDESPGGGDLLFAEVVREAQEGLRIPRATYRLQFGRNFTFRNAAEWVAYGDALGISDLYASPLFKPCKEDHGYDVCNHKEFNPALGRPEDFDALSAALQGRSMGLLLDMVPNHMGISGDNPWWRDVLENGPNSLFSCYFDIDLHPAKPELENKVLLPILEDQYGKVLEGGKFRLRLEEGAFFIDYYDHQLPVAPWSYKKILSHPVEALVVILGKENEHLQELQSILTALSHLPLRVEADLQKLEEQKREKEVIKRRIATLCGRSPEIKAAIDSTVQVFNGRTGDPRSYDLLDDLMNAQAYRPAFWRVAADEINYRRFFDLNHLAALRMELPEVFRETHQFLFRLLREGKITGLRIDHPDGLWNPADYFHQLQKSHLLWKARDRLGLTEGSESSEENLNKSVRAWMAERLSGKGNSAWPLYVVAEKILSHGEPLPRDWAVYGTTGYDFLNEVNALFVAGGNVRAMDRIYTHFVGAQIHFVNLVNTWKRMIMLVSLASEVAALSHQLERISEKNREFRDFTLNSLTFVLREVIACLPVYRTYITGPENVPERDAASVEAAVEEAKRRNPRTAESIFDFVRDTLLLRNLQNFSAEDRQGLIQFAMKFQQITGPVMAKGLEDTTFYIYNRLVSLNEVGGHPEEFGVSPEEFHRQNIERLEKWPHSLLATSTHDTKRSEDVRARIDVLSEIPGEWRAAVSRWGRWNAPKKTPVDGQPAPDRNDEYLLYQTLVGAWPMEDPDHPLSLRSEEFLQFRERMVAYMRKATLEAKVHTSWVNPNEEYDGAVKDFVLKLLELRGKNRFLSDLQTFQRRVAYFGQWNALSQVLLKLTCPGVPDFYQGTELWDLSLVDPDNRRLVDYRRRQTFLADLTERVKKGGDDLVPVVRDLLETAWDGRIKLYLIYRTLNFRRDHPELFLKGGYVPLEGEGEKKNHLFAFLRTWGEEAILVAIPRLVVGLTGGMEEPPLGEKVWKDTGLQFPVEQGVQRYRNLYTGRMISVEKRDGRAALPLSQVFADFPLAFLERIP